MLIDERRHRIAMFVLERGGVTVSELSERFGVSAVTIRSDLESLEQAGVLKRSHGGAVAHRVARFSPAFQERSSVNLHAKRAIAEVASGLVEDGDKVFLDAGSTTLLLARVLRTRDVTVATNSLYVMNEMINASKAELVMIGGELYEPGLSFVGSLAVRFVQGIHVDIAFLGTNGLCPRGMFVNNAVEAGIKHAMIASAHRSVVLADSSKIGLESFVLVAPLAELGMALTDAAAPAALVEEIRDAGLEVTVV